MDQALPMVMELNQKIDLLTTQVQFLTDRPNAPSASARNAPS